MSTLFADLAQKSELERITAILTHLKKDLRVGFIVEARENCAKGDRYLATLRQMLAPTDVLEVKRHITGAPEVEFIQLHLSPNKPESN